MSAIMRPIAVLLTAAALWIAAPIVIFTTPAAAQARVEISAEFRSALEPYGEFRQHSRWGEVWVPAAFQASAEIGDGPGARARISAPSSTRVSSIMPSS